MQKLRSFLFALGVALGGCATVSTQVVQLNPAQAYPPTQFVEILLEKPARPHVEIAMLESRGESEAELFNDARAKAAALGADAIVRQEIQRQFHQPVAVYDPWYDPFYWGPYPYRHRHYSPFAPVYPSLGAYHVLPGGFSYLLKATAIRYLDRDETPSPAVK